MLQAEMTLTALKRDLSPLLMDPDDYIMGKKIGEGGFGQVCLARQKSTGVQVAIKKSLEALTAETEKYYCREVRILAGVDNPFLLGLIGFTPEAPFTIITKYIKNGCLLDYLRKNPEKQLTGTQKTIIAMGIAHGMARFHELGLMHRDLKSPNILLDENMYPVVCDYGIAREKDEEMAMRTKGIGSMLWMAPEMIQGEDYNSLIDVYSYAMVLYEMMNEKLPFAGLKPRDLYEAISNAYRPKLDENTPPGLKQLINLCWAQNPSERPAFSQVYSLFESKLAYFPDTDFDAIDRVTEFIHSRAGSKTQPGKITFENIVDPVSPVSPQCMTKFIESIKFDECSNLVLRFSEYLSSHSVAEEVRYSIYAAILQIVTKGIDFSHLLAQTDIPTLLCFDGKLSAQNAFTVFAAFLKDAPQFCQIVTLRKLIDSQLKRNHHLVMYVLSLYFDYLIKDESIHAEATIFEFVAFFVNLVDDLVKYGEIPSYLNIIANFFSTSTILAELTMGLIQDSLNKIFKLSLENEKTHEINAYAIHMAYRFVIKFPIFTIAETELHAKEKMLRPIVSTYILSIMIQNKSYMPPIPMKVSSLMHLCEDYPDARVLVLLLSRSQEWAQKFAKSKEAWVFKETIPSDFYIRLFLQVTKFHNCMKRLLSNNEIYTLFAQIAELHVPQISSVICTIISKIPSTLMTKERIIFLEQANFWAHIINGTMKSEDVNDQKACFSVIAFHALTYITNQMAQIYSYIGPNLNNGSPLRLHALSVMRPFMEVPVIKKKFEEKGFIDLVRLIEANSSTQAFIQAILQYY